MTSEADFEVNVYGRGRFLAADPGAFLSCTWHMGHHSMQMQVEVSKGRMQSGEVDRIQIIMRHPPRVWEIKSQDTPLPISYAEFMEMCR